MRELNYHRLLSCQPLLFILEHLLFGPLGRLTLYLLCFLLGSRIDLFMQYVDLMLLHEGFLVLDSTAREKLEPEGVLGYRSFQHLNAHTNDENRDELDRDNQDQDKDQPHDKVTIDKLVIFAGLVVQTEVNDCNLYAE